VAGAIASGARGYEPGGGSRNPFAYYVDSLFRSDHPDANARDQDLRAVATHIIATGNRQW
jgi:hypothetical protein